MIISVTYIVYLKLSVLWLHILFSPVMRVDRALRGVQRVTGHSARSTRFHTKCVCSSWTNNDLFGTVPTGYDFREYFGSKNLKINK